MAPSRPRQPSIDRSEEYEEFMKSLEEYHEKRGTILEREPKIAGRHMDLFRLYKRVCEEGGYDVMSDTKAKKLAWRRLTAEFLPSSSGTQLMTQAFLLKTAYYKNLAAYEISNVHKTEPPPKEILEDVSAKGGSLLTRTLENFTRPTMNRETARLTNGIGGIGDKGSDSDASDDEKKATPQADEDKMDVDEPTTTSGRASRALRHAPPQRVLFQPDTSSSRASPRRNMSAKGSSPAPATPHSQPQTNGIPQSNGATITIANFEPKLPISCAVKAVPTPGNNPEYFRQLREKVLASKRLTKEFSYPRGVMLPGTGYCGPGIYQRALLALQSSEPAERDFALHHFVKISHERGDKFRFADFAGLAEALMSPVLEVTPLFYNARWEVSYHDDGPGPWNVLDGIRGTPDLLDRINGMRLLDTNRDEMHTEEFSKKLARINEAMLIIRNMSLLEDNAAFISRRPLLRDILTIILNLPYLAVTLEVKQYALEITEQITKYFALAAKDPLYRTLVAQLDSQDRGTIITSLRALSRVAMLLETSNRLSNIPRSTLQHITDWLLVDDEELCNACLDFLYQFTAITPNVEFMLRTINMDALISQLVRLLMFNSIVDDRTERFRSHERAGHIPDFPPKLASSIVQHLLQYIEPERSSQWLKTCFVEESGAEVTQVALWQAYQNCFQESAQSRSTLSAKDFITNVSATFPTAVAHVLPGPKYIIRGVRPRDVAVDQRGRPYLRCQWHVDATGQECGEYGLRADAEGMWEHILSAHFGIPKNSDGKFYMLDDNANAMDFVNSNGITEHITTINDKGLPDVHKPVRRFNCRWGGCKHFAATNGALKFAAVGRHIQTHLPDTSPQAAQRQKHNRTDPEPPRTAHPRIFMNTQMDERADAAGLPLASVLVLRNLARQVAKVEPTKGRLGGKEEVERENLVGRFFTPVKEQLYHVMAFNVALREYIVSLTRLITAGGG